jgi:hypothetical protein
MKKSSEVGGIAKQQEQRNTKEQRNMGRSSTSGGAKLAPFCKRTKSFFVKFLPKEALKKRAIERLHRPKPKAHTET